MRRSFVTSLYNVVLVRRCLCVYIVEVYIVFQPTDKKANYSRACILFDERLLLSLARRHQRRSVFLLLFVCIKRKTTRNETLWPFLGTTQTKPTIYEYYTFTETSSVVYRLDCAQWTEIGANSMNFSSHTSVRASAASNSITVSRFSRSPGLLR